MHEYAQINAIPAKEARSHRQKSVFSGWDEGGPQRNLWRSGYPGPAADGRRRPGPLRDAAASTILTGLHGPAGYARPTPWTIAARGIVTLYFPFLPIPRWRRWAAGAYRRPGHRAVADPHARLPRQAPARTHVRAVDGRVRRSMSTAGQPLYGGLVAIDPLSAVVQDLKFSLRPARWPVRPSRPDCVV